VLLLHSLLCWLSPVVQLQRPLYCIIFWLVVVVVLLLLPLRCPSYVCWGRDGGIGLGGQGAVRKLLLTRLLHSLLLLLQRWGCCLGCLARCPRRGH
jgi:hypothetical protein